MYQVLSLTHNVQAQDGTKTERGQFGELMTALGNWGGAQVQVPQLQVKSQAIFLDTT